MSVCLCVCVYRVGVQTSEPIVTKFGRSLEGHKAGDLGIIKVTSRNRKWPYRTKMAASRHSVGPQRQGNCSIAPKFGTGLECHPAENVGEPEVTSQNRKWHHRTKMAASRHSVRPQGQGNCSIATKLGTSPHWHLAETIEYVIKPEMTSQNQNGRHPFSSRHSVGPQGQGNCSIAPKFGTGLECHPAENVGEPEVTSQNRKWPHGTGSDAL